MTKKDYQLIARVIARVGLMIGDDNREVITAQFIDALYADNSKFDYKIFTNYINSHI